ncbi:MAG TPA: dual specificity protein phosphatase [Pirellulaceae bacterium]|nr:dual specificity protein phosphatase [Pirellulaceae bacterium]
MTTPIFHITKCLWLGPFASPQRLSQLREAGITHVLNVSEAPSVLTVAQSGLADIRWHPLEDLSQLPVEETLACLAELHTMATLEASRVYVHCIAGQNRSPTVLWLYLVACGIGPDEAKEVIGRRAPDAVPGHGRLVSAELIAAAQDHGQRNFLPLSRGEIIEPA